MIGHVVDGLEILRPLGAGGMGEVYLARDPAGALRAFKVVRADRADPKTVARFRRELHALGKLRHPGIVQILDAGSLPDGQLYLGMEYVPGSDLQAAVRFEGPLAVGDSLRMVLRLAHALAYAHAAGVVHRDLKPGNVILEGGDPGKAKIIDFGLAKVAAEEGLTRLTEDQQALGSPLYWAPEQSSNREVGPAVDVYALAGVAYFALSGVPLFAPAPPVALVYAHANEAPEPLAERCRGVTLPQGLAELIAACAMKSPASRPSAEEIAGEVEQLLGRLSPSEGAGRMPGPVQLHDQHALRGQIRRALLDLAATIDHPVDDVERIGGELMELELELAMLEADCDPRLDVVRAQVAQLQAAFADAYRELHAVLAARRGVAPSEAADLYAELDSLMEQHGPL